ncbi:MAG: hypothetical protein K2N47_00210, partial [Clostridia bacterium]|nr:hypothetical protein [Clostridia bacterium]
MKRFDIGFSLSDSEYMTALRLAVGAVCAAADVDIDGAEDMKVCVTESCLLLKDGGFESVKISLATEGGVSAVVDGVGGKAVAGDNYFSIALISAIVSA